MPTRDYRPFTTAILEQLRAEIGVKGWSVTKMAQVMDIDYSTFRNYVLGKRDMPVDVLNRALEALDLDYSTFLARASSRQGTPPTQ